MIKINPDITFIKRVKKESGSDLKTCMQCGNCTVVCSLSADDNLFPRKEMIWAAWGLKEKLYENTSIWSCHQCGDCNIHCPRGVKPGNIIAALRSLTIEHYALPSFLARWMKKPIFLPLFLSVPIILIHLLLILNHTLTNTAIPVNYAEFFPHKLLNSFFSTIVIILLIAMFFSLRKFFKTIKKSLPENEIKNSFILSLTMTIKEIFSHQRFAKCESDKSRQLSHLLVFYGFISLILVTLYAIVAVFFEQYPMPFTHPVKLFSNVAGLAILTGLILMLINRIRLLKTSLKSTFSDWSFLISLIFLVSTGFLTEYARLLNIHFAYYWYLFHLIIMWYVVLFFPYSKFAHFAYRFMAILLKKRHTHTHLMS